MKLNKFLWDNYIQSKQGIELIQFFTDLKKHYDDNSKQLKSFMASWKGNKVLKDDTDVDFRHSVSGVIKAIKDIEDAVNKKYLPRKIKNNKDADIYYYKLSELVTDDDEDVDMFYLEDIPELSVALYCIQPEYFFPYYFYFEFHFLKKIFDEFGIFFPSVPPKRDRTARYSFYNELCRSLCTFWDELGFKKEHIPAFLYGYAPKVIELKRPQLDELPKPHRAWFIGGGINNNGDFHYLDQIDNSATTYWQGNIDTEAGDIIVMYCLTPRSRIHSIWRATQEGSVEPFFSFYSSVHIAFPQVVKGLTLNEIKSDPILSQLGLVRQNMQGINGRNISKEFYDRILFLLKNKGEKISELPQLENIERKNIKIRNEKDVEEKILEPLLQELGFKSEDWERQVILRVGRKERAIPDYLVHTRKTAKPRNVSADWVWEAKFSIKGNDQLQKDFEQVFSYAKIVGAEGVSLISKEGLWIVSKKDGLNLRKAKYFSAVQIQEIGVLNELRALAGKKALTK
ncbi:MAG: hypothetical protein ACXVCY_15030 [Pseudobdellovibrionaceae bacterium]